MDFWAVMVVTLVGGGVMVAGGFLVHYVASLAKSAYQIKIELRSDLEEGLRRLEEEMDKKSRWVKRDLIEEFEKIRVALQTDNTRRFSDHTEVVGRKLAELETALRTERTEVMALMDSHRQSIVTLDQRLRTLRHAVRQEAAAPDATTAKPDDAPPPAEDPIPAETPPVLAAMPRAATR